MLCGLEETDCACNEVHVMAALARKQSLLDRFVVIREEPAERIKLEVGLGDFTDGCPVVAQPVLVVVAKFRIVVAANFIVGGVGFNNDGQRSAPGR